MGSTMHASLTIYLLGVSAIAAAAIRMLPPERKKGFHISVAVLIAATIAAEYLIK